MTRLRDVAPGLWIWSTGHPDWKPGVAWSEEVTSTCVESGGEVVVLDPLAPPADATDVWERLDAHPPTAVVILKPDHVRDVDLFVERYDARAFGPYWFWRDNTPRPSSRGSSRVASCRVGSSPSTTGAVATRRRSGSPRSGRSSSRTA